MQGFRNPTDKKVGLPPKLGEAIIPIQLCMPSTNTRDSAVNESKMGRVSTTSTKTRKLERMSYIDKVGTSICCAMCVCVRAVSCIGGHV